MSGPTPSSSNVFNLAAALGGISRALVYPWERNSVRSIALKRQDPRLALFRSYVNPESYNGLAFTVLSSALRNGVCALTGRKVREALPDAARGRDLYTGLCMGAMESLWYPTSSVKVKIQSQSQAISVTRAFRGLSSANLYRGCLAMVLRNLTWNGANVPLYAALRSEKDSLSQQVIKGAATAQVSSVLSYPWHVVSVRQVQLSRPRLKPGMVRVIKKIWEQKGWRGFFTGFSHALARTAALSLVVGPITEAILKD